MLLRKPALVLYSAQTVPIVKLNHISYIRCAAVDKTDGAVFENGDVTNIEAKFSIHCNTVLSMYASCSLTRMVITVPVEVFRPFDTVNILVILKLGNTPRFTSALSHGLRSSSRQNHTYLPLPFIRVYRYHHQHRALVQESVCAYYCHFECRHRCLRVQSSFYAYHLNSARNHPQYV